MKIFGVNFIYINILLLVESLIVTSLLVLFYKGTEDCPWTIYKGHFFSFLIKYHFMKLIFFLVPLSILISLIFKDFYNYFIIRQIVIYFFSFICLHIILIGLFRGGVELGVPKCVPFYISLLIVYGAVLAAPYILKITGVLRLLHRI